MLVGDKRALTGLEARVARDLDVQSAEQAGRNREVLRAIRTANQLNPLGPNTELRYSVELESRQLLIRLVDRVTNEVIRQVPSETVLRVAEAIRNLSGER